MQTEHLVGTGTCVCVCVCVRVLSCVCVTHTQCHVLNVYGTCIWNVICLVIKCLYLLIYRYTTHTTHILSPAQVEEVPQIFRTLGWYGEG